MPAAAFSGGKLKLSRLESRLRPGLAAPLLLVFVIFAAPKNNR
jgi:hypothetical protein